jgi:hypothetical protein
LVPPDFFESRKSQQCQSQLSKNAVGEKREKCTGNTLSPIPISITREAIAEAIEFSLQALLDHIDEYTVKPPRN